MNIFSVYHRNETELSSIAKFLAGKETKALADNDSALYYDEPMFSHTIETEMSFEELKKVLDNADKKDYIICIEENWFCD